MKNRPDDPHSRDTVLRRLLAEALDAQSASQSLAGSVCPDAEIIAAYAERGLADEEAVHWEIHFAGCARCQKIIAALAVTADESDVLTGVLTEDHAEAEELKISPVMVGALHSTPAVAAQPVATIRRRRTIWYWLVPAMALTSVAALWFALQPGPRPPSLSSQRIAASGEPLTGGVPEVPAASLAQPQAPESQIAQSYLPPPPQALKPPPPPPPATPSESRSGEADQSVANSASAAARAVAPALQSSAKGLAAPPPEAEKKEDQVLSAQAAEQKSDTTDAFTGPSSPAAPPAAPSAQPSPAPSNPNAVGSASRLGGAAIAGFAGKKVTALAKTGTPLVVFASPVRNSLWRLGSGGRIEHSTDGGLTWQMQSSGVTADLLAGAAPSEMIAWVVGRAGTILRTTDGERWQPVPPPSGPASDWIKVEARDGLHAAVTSRDLRRFATEDGGRTWLQQQ